MPPLRSELTMKMYGKALARLREATDMSPPAVIAYIDGMSVGASAKKMYYSAVLSEGKNELYSAKVADLAKHLQDISKRQEMTAREEGKILAWSEVLAVVAKAKPDLTEDFQAIQDWVILNLYTLHAPLRADYADMKVFRKTPKGEAGNFLVLRKSKPFFVFQEYKTVSKFGKQTIPLVPRLAQVLQEWMTINPSDHLLINTEGKPMSPQNLSDRVIAIFTKATGKPCGISALRHSYITEKRSGKELTYLEKEALALSMLHSQPTNELYRRPTLKSPET